MFGCALCYPFDCDDPDNHLGALPEYTPLKNRGCHCGADYDGRDCMCFEECEHGLSASLCVGFSHYPEGA